MAAALDRGLVEQCGSGDEKEELTAMRQGRSAASGMLWTRRIDEVNFRSPEVKTMLLRLTGASSGRVRWACCSMGSWRRSGTRRGTEGVVVAVVELIGGGSAVW